MSRSCQRATFSIAGERVAADHAREPADPLARPPGSACAASRSSPSALGERLLDLADLGAREVADLGGERVERRRRRARSPSRSSAWRSRWMIWVDASAGRSPSRPHTISSTRGSTLAYDPTTPLIAPTLTASRAAPQPLAIAVELEREHRELVPERGRLGVHAVRPADAHRVAVREGLALDRAEQRARGRPAATSAAARSCSANPVSSTSLDVIPKWIQRPSSPIDAATTSTNAATSCRVTASRSRTASTVNDARSRHAAASAAGIAPSSAHASTASSSISSQFAIRASSDQMAATSGTSYARATHSFSPSARSSLNFQSAAWISSSATPRIWHARSAAFTARVDADGGDRDARRHLRRDRERLVADHLRRGRDRDADHRQDRPRGDGGGEVPREPGRADHDLQAALERGPRVLVDQIGVPRRRHDPDLVRHLELLQDQPGLAHDRQLGGRGGEDADHRRRVAHRLAPSSAAARAAMSVRWCIPSNWMRSTPAYARVPRLGERRAGPRDAHDAAAGGHELSVAIPGGAGMEDGHAGDRLGVLDRRRSGGRSGSGPG